MRLYSIEYTEYDEHSFKWSLEKLTLINFNLIVGKNAVGKSRILRIINGLAKLISGNALPLAMETGNYKVVFRDSPLLSKEVKPAKPDIEYEFEIHNQKVKSELLKVGGIVKLNRKSEGRGIIHFDAEDKSIEIQVPEGNLTIASRRDSKQHSFFEDLHQWASSVQYFEFSDDRQKNISIVSDLATPLKSNSTETNFHLMLQSSLNKFSQDLIRPVISNMRKIGYEITDFGLMPMTGLNTPIINSGVPLTLYIKESGIDKKLPQNNISAGMFRAISTLILLQTIKLEKTPACVLIDDIGEGLDYDRATKLISIVISYADEGYSQYCMTSNDRFVMNKIPLEYWCVVERNFGVVKSYTPRNSPIAYSDFDKYGFNNFDFFADGFFNKQSKEK
jgi:energy-coupling factor transporter ATP-binding protein EcfA2